MPPPTGAKGAKLGPFGALVIIGFIILMIVAIVYGKNVAPTEEICVGPFCDTRSRDWGGRTRNQLTINL